MNAVGVWFYSAATDRYLYLMRDDAKHPGSWGLPGGKAEAGESLLVAMKRECEEEIGGFPDFVKLILWRCSPARTASSVTILFSVALMKNLFQS